MEFYLNDFEQEIYLETKSLRLCGGKTGRQKLHSSLHSSPNCKCGWTLEWQDTIANQSTAIRLSIFRIIFKYSYLICKSLAQCQKGEWICIPIDLSPFWHWRCKISPYPSYDFTSCITAFQHMFLVLLSTPTYTAILLPRSAAINCKGVFPSKLQILFTHVSAEHHVFKLGSTVT